MMTDPASVEGEMELNAEGKAMLIEMWHSFQIDQSMKQTAKICGEALLTATTYQESEKVIARILNQIGAGNKPLIQRIVNEESAKLNPGKRWLKEKKAQSTNRSGF